MSLGASPIIRSTASTSSCPGTGLQPPASPSQPDQAKPHAKPTQAVRPRLLTNNAAERALRGIALGRRNWLFAGSFFNDTATTEIYTLIATAKLNDVDPQ